MRRSFISPRRNRRAVGDVQDGADFRRARLWAEGDVWDNAGYKIEFDFGFPGRPSFMDLWFELREVVGNATFRVGQYRQPIGMNGLNSVMALPFIERPLPFALLPFRQIGGMFFGTGENDATTWAISAFRFPTDVFGGNVGDNGGYGLAARLTAIAMEGDGKLLHIGGTYSYADPSDDAMQILSAPEFFLFESGLAALEPAGIPTATPPFVNTGPVATSNYNLFGLEAAYRYGQFYMQSEALIAVLDQRGAGAATLPGIYVHAGYFLTGEIRPYDRKNGVLGKVKPLDPFGRCGGKGAWEVAARWSYLDLNDAGIRGGTTGRHHPGPQLVSQPAHQIPVQLHPCHVEQSGQW